MLSSKLHVARWRKARANDPDIHAFVAWLTAEAEQTRVDTKKLLRSLATASDVSSGDAANQPVALARRR
jgi:hypothetical protein